MAAPAAGDVTAADDHFAETATRFRVASRRVGLVERTYRIAGHRVLVRSAGCGLMDRMHRALDRGSSTRDQDRDRAGLGDDSTASLTVEMWESVESGVSPGRAPWAADDLRPLGLVRSLCDERHLVAVDLHTSSVSQFDRATSTARFWVRDATRIKYWQAASPLRLILSWWGSTLGMQLAHAAGVATEDGGVLLVGGAGAGKSTTSLTCLAGGLGFLGDDYCMVAAEPAPVVHGVYTTAKLRPDTYSRLPQLLDVTRNADRLDREKGVLDLTPRFDAQLIASAPIRAIAVPRVTGRFARTPIAPGAVLRALAPSTVFGLFGATPEAVPLMRRLASAAPGFLLELGDDLDRVCDEVAALAALGVSG